MIDDGPFYKKILWRSFRRFEADLQSWSTKKVEYHIADTYWRTRLELILFEIGLGVRRLIDSKKMSIEFQAEQVHAMRAPIADKRRIPVHLNSHHVHRFYDFSKQRKTGLRPYDLCNQIVHSYVLHSNLEWSGIGRPIVDIYIASDTKRKSMVYHIQWSQIRELMDRLVLDNIASHLRIHLDDGDEIDLATSDANKPGSKVLAEYARLSKANQERVDAAVAAGVLPPINQPS